MHSNDLDQSVSPSITSDAPKPSRKGIGGAPSQNANAQRHGIRTWRERRQMPRGANLEEQELTEERQRLTEAVQQRYGEIPAQAHGLIEATLTHRGRMLLAERYRRTSKLTMGEKLALSQEAGRAAESYVRSLQRLGLQSGAGDSDPWAGLDLGDGDGWTEHGDGMHETATSGRQATEGNQDATEATQAGQVLPAGGTDSGSDRGSTPQAGGSTQT